MMARGRAVLVTGASRGIGAAVARAFAAAGDRVAVHYGASREAAREVAASLPGDGHVVVGADLADPEAVRAMVDEAAAAARRPRRARQQRRHLRAAPDHRHDLRAVAARLARHAGVNLLGAANVTWCAVRHMIEAGGGRIVNVSSRGAFRGEPGQPAYGASKAAISPSASRSPAPSARTASPSPRSRPGFTETDMAAETLAGPRGAEIRAESPLGRVATPEEVARAVLYLASPEAEMASGRCSTSTARRSCACERARASARRLAALRGQGIEGRGAAGGRGARGRPRGRACGLRSPMRSQRPHGPRVAARSRGRRDRRRHSFPR